MQKVRDRQPRMCKKRLDAGKSLRQHLGMRDFRTPSDIIAYIGHERAAEVLGVPVSTVLRYRWRDKLPAAWLDALEEAASRSLPRDVFSFKRASDEASA